ncbi:MAG: putative glycolipid-binding domain-containing protein [Caldilineaceae bacterium]|nr:putative glycolipid-binding domain-containing protein [Caldilineaceae bacterium]
MAEQIRTLIWRSLGALGTEHAVLARGAGGHELKGHVVSVADEAPLYVHYVVFCDSSWRTRMVTIEVHHGLAHRRLSLTVTAGRRWFAGESEIIAVHGCLDVDLGVTPATNTLPVRRLDLAVGEQAEVTAAWVRFPDLAVAPLAQRYVRLSETVYRYESSTGFTAAIEVDEMGLVVAYEGAWIRAAAA